jgi:oligopeptide/dipeptide ABC transporter ATP-binding protein
LESYTASTKHNTTAAASLRSADCGIYGEGGSFADSFGRGYSWPSFYTFKPRNTHLAELLPSGPPQFGVEMRLSRRPGVDDRPAFNISHDLGVVVQIADKVMVMYAGRAVEQGTTDEVFYDPLMPYSWSLLRSIPRLGTAGELRLLSIQGTPPSLIFLPKGCNFSPRCPFPIPDPEKERARQRIVLSGDVPSPANPPQGCSFHTRCPRAQEYCVEHEPGLEPQEDHNHRAACFFPVMEGQRIEEPATSTPYRAGG